MKKAKVFAGFVNGTWTEIKAFKKSNAVSYMQKKDSSVKAKDVKITTSINSHQAPVDEDEEI